MAVKITHSDIGDLLVPQATFTLAGTNTDPTNLTVRQQDADGVETVILNNVLVSTLNSGTTPVAKTATGIFKLNPGVSAVKQGYWFFRFEGTGAVTAAEEFQYNVDPSEFTSNAGLDARALISLVEMKEWLNYTNVETTNDLEIVGAINYVSDRMHQEAGREFKPITAGPGVVRLFDVESLALNGRTVFVGDLASAPTLVRILDKDGVSQATVAAGDQILLPRIREAWEPIQRIRFSTDVTQLAYGQTVEVTGTWGFPSIPGNIKQAMYDAVAYVLDRDVEHYSTDLGVVAGGGVALMLSLPPSALEVANSYKNPVVA